MKIYELKPMHDTRKSFGGKAQIIEYDENNLQLQSYNTIVAEIKNGLLKVYNIQSSTTLRHVKEFIWQNGYGEWDKQAIENCLMKKKEI